MTPADKLKRALASIRNELDERIILLESQSRLLEAQRLKMRTEYDLEMLQEMGFCNGIENYSRHLTGRPPGSKPFTLLDFFPKDFLLVIDESHATIPQIGGMYEGDKSRKTVLVEYGFRLPSALDNRPLNFKEFMGMTNQIAYVSATPAEFEIKNSVVGNTGYFPHKRERIGEDEPVPFLVAGGGKTAAAAVTPISRTDQPIEEFDVHTPGMPLVVEQIIRPTGLLDPKITLKPLKNQIDETIELCRQRVEAQERVLVTTLTKRTAEDLSDYLRDVGLKVRYLHSDIDTIERVEILRGLRAADFDILVGINLLREGLDLPEVSLVCILDADKEGFLRSQTSLIQTAGRAARHINGEVVLFADTMTQSMQALISITDYRRTQADGVQREAQHHAHDREARHPGKPAHHLERPRDRRQRRAGSRRRFQPHRTPARTRRRHATRQREPGIRTRRPIARPNHGSKKRHRPRQNRAETQAGEIFLPWRRRNPTAPRLAGLTNRLEPWPTIFTTRLTSRNARSPRPPADRL